MIALFGGTFDPVHSGHLHAALASVRALGCPVRMVLSPRPPLRPPPAAEAAHRWTMLKLACADHPEVLADDTEMRRDGQSYTVDTLRAVRRTQPHAPLCWIIGTDAFNAIHSWHDWREVLSLAHLILLRRPGAPIAGPAQQVFADHRRRDVTAAPGGGVLLLEAEMLPLSASDARARIAAGGDLGGLLPQAVWAYIRRHGLYRGER